MNVGERSIVHRVALKGLRAKTEEKIIEPRFTIGSTGIGYRRMTNWGKEKLIPAEFEAGKWRRFAYIELIWFGIVDLLRTFDLPIEIIKNLKDSLWEEVSSWDLFQQPGLRQLIDQLDFIGKMGYDSEDLTNETKQAMKEDKHTWLFFLLMDELIVRSHLMILVNREGKITPLKISSPEENAVLFPMPEFIENSFIAVSLSEVIRKSVHHMEVREMFEALGLITPKQATILSLLNAGKLNSLRVMDFSGKETRLVDEAKLMVPEPADQLLKKILANQCQSIQATSDEGKVINVEL